MEKEQRKETEMKKLNEEILMFREWYRKNWLTAGGLVPKATAARLLGKSKGRITQMVREGKLKEHQFNPSISYLEAPEVFRLMHKEEYKLFKDTLYEQAEDLPETHRQSFIDAMMPTLERQEKEIDPVQVEKNEK